MRSRSVALATPCLVAVALITSVTASGANVQHTSSGGRRPSVSAPSIEGKGIQALATDYDFASLGYERDEYFVEGEAVGYEPVGTLKNDGKWRVEETETAPFKTRMVIIKPADPSDFNGTVYVEWFNVTGGVDAGPTWINAHNEILRSGAAWVGVTAQAVGVKGGTQTVQSSTVAIPQGGLVNSDPERYGTLSHPGDLYAYDIFTQAGSAIRGDGSGVDPFQGYKVKRLIAAGESQSAGRLTTYANAVQPLVHGYDGFLIYSRGASAAPFGERPVGADDPTIPDAARIRTDIDVPVFTFETEYDVDVLGYADARQPDAKNFRLWEMAGGSHQDSYAASGTALTDLGDGSAEVKLLDPAQATTGALNCAEPINAGNQYAVVQSALAHLDTWVRKGTAPPKLARIKTTGSGEAVEITRDDLGIARGGLRTPIVEVPLAANIGDAGNTPDFCRVFGHSRPFDAATLARLYPGGSDEYALAFVKSANKAVEDGVWLEPEAKNFKQAARSITFG